jgi:hypothetical protein
MLRANLYKKFSKSNLPKAVDGVRQDPNPNSLVVKDNPKTSNWGEAENFQFSFPNPNLVNISDKPGTLYAEANTEGQTNITGTPTGSGIPFNGTADNRGTAKLPNLGVQTPDFLRMFGQGQNIIQGSPLGTTVKTDLNGNQSSFAPGYSPATATQKTQVAPKKSPLDYNSMFTLGLGAVNMGLGFNEDLRNRRDLNESIQNRNSKPVYDYNYMYGRTTSGGTEYQPTIKAEMGAQITKRQNTPYGANNVEIEGGEFIQLPNFDTEYAEGPSHEQGGVKTSLPEGTRVYSDHLKPEGSKKTFAQLAKKYDTSKFKETLDSPFKKQVDKDTANIMMTRNQKMLDELFSKQQSMNGDSNGEMRDGGIHNPGFMALPKAVQEKILANMEYGGYQLPEYATGGNTIDPYEKSKTPEGAVTPTGQSNKFSARKQKLGEYLNQWEEYIPGVSKLNEGQAQEAIYDYQLKNNPEAIKSMWSQYGITAKGKKDKNLYSLTKEGKFDESTLTPENLAKLKSAYVDNYFGVRQMDPKKKVGETPVTTPETPKVEPTTPVVQPEFPKGNTYGMQGTTPKGKYTKDPFNVGSLIPNVYGLAEAQTTYPYAIPEIDAPYLKPQTLNIQSQLQDIDNMGTAAVRSGADPMTAYLAGLDAKQKSFQTKQNYDAEGRSKADMFNAEGKMRTDVFNAEAFDKNYNERNALAKAYQSQEKSKQLANAVDKYSDWNKTEASKKFLYDNFVTSFDLDRAKSDEMTVTQDSQPFYVGNPIQNIINQAVSPATKSTKSSKSTKKGKLGLSVDKKSSLSKYKK